MATKTKSLAAVEERPRRAPSKLTDNRAEAVGEFARDPDEPEESAKLHGLYPDRVVAGLFKFVGPRKTVWRFRQRRQTKNAEGKRPTIAKTLGVYPEMTADDARKEALILAGDAAKGKPVPSKRDAVTFARAWPLYLEKLLRKARDSGKPPRHHSNAVKLGSSLILPQWGKWTLYDLAHAPEDVEQWHAKITRTNGPVSANRACELIRATYKHRAARDTTLSLERTPTSSVQWNKETPAQIALAPADFKKWRTAWDDIENDIHKGYFLFCILTGVRPGEGARIRKQDIDRKARTFTVPNAKAGKDIVLPMTPEIEYAIDLALSGTVQPATITMRGLRGMKPGEVRVVERKRPHHEVIDPDLVFPGCRQMPSRTGLPVAGNGLRHAYKTMHVALGISETLSAFLMGHALEGVSAKYIAEMIVLRSAELREAQERISAQVFGLLGLTLDDAPTRAPHADTHGAKG